MSALPRLTIRRGQTDRIRSGHPWVFRNEIQGATSVPQPGAVVDFVDAAGQFLARGTFNPAVYICGRVFTRVPEPIDASFFRRRIEQAMAVRKRLYPREASYRLVSSEGDLLPGLIVDRYEKAVCIQALTAGMERCLGEIQGALQDLLRPDILVLRNDARVREEEGLPCETRVLAGDPSSPLAVGVQGLSFEVNLLKGYKTGLYLDQKENWRLVRPFSEGARVLDCFCYAGGFALSAARLGAREVVGIDLSGEAVRQAGRNARLNGLESACRFEAANAFDWMKERARKKEQFDLIVLDPPSFTRRKGKVPEALRGYKEIHLQALRLLKPGGHLLTFTCSYHVGRDLFLACVREAAADLGRTVVLEQHLGQARDHPVRLECPETEYLKGAILRAD